MGVPEGIREEARRLGLSYYTVYRRLNRGKPPLAPLAQSKIIYRENGHSFRTMRQVAVFVGADYNSLVCSARRNGLEEAVARCRETERID